MNEMNEVFLSRDSSLFVSCPAVLHGQFHIAGDDPLFYFWLLSLSPHLHTVRDAIVQWTAIRRFVANDGSRYTDKFTFDGRRHDLQHRITMPAQIEERQMWREIRIR